MTESNNIAEAFRILRTVLKPGEHFYPDRPIDGVWMTGGHWIRLAQRKMGTKIVLSGLARLYWTDKGRKYYSRVLVNFPAPWEETQRKAILADTMPGKIFAGCSLESFVLSCPLRLSHSSDVVLLHPSDIAPDNIKVRPIVDYRIDKRVVGTVSGSTAVRVEMFYAGKFATTEIITLSGEFEFLGETYASTTEAFLDVVDRVNTGPIDVNGNRVLPKAQSYVLPITVTQLKNCLSELAVLRKEGFNPNPILNTHMPEAPPLLPLAPPLIPEAPPI